MISVSNLTVTYAHQNQPSLVIDNLHIEQGECFVLCGQSGSGKTSFTRLLNGLIPEYYPAKIDGRMNVVSLIPGQESVEEFSQLVASVFQNPATQFFHRQVEHELVFPCENLGFDPQQIEQQLQATVAFFNLEDLLKQDLLAASGGQRQRIALATAQMQAPKILVLDEPSANLDQEGVNMLHEHIQQLKGVGITIVIAEHRLDFLKDLADCYLYFDKGRASQLWTREQWLALSDTDRHAMGLRGLAFKKDEAGASQMDGSGLDIKGLELKTKTFNLGRISDLHFPSNNVTALVGKNGLGKSTLAQLISGLERAEAHISLDGKVLTDKERMAKTAFVMQDVRLQLFSDSVHREILLGNKPDDKRFKQVVEHLHLQDLLDRHPMSLSGGEQQRVMIANALLSDKKIFIFDEPTSGLDYGQMQEVAELLQELKAPDRVIIVITHDFELIERACQQIRALQRI